MVESYPVDLHLHTTCSDGSLDPLSLVSLAASRDIKAIAITDHDTVAAYKDRSLNLATENAGLELIGGVEISTEDNVSRMHVLGLDIDVHDPEMVSWLDSLQDSRVVYAREMAQAFEGAGWKVEAQPTKDSIVHTKASIAGAILSKAENAKRLIDLFGEIPTKGQFIEELMNKGKEFYLARLMPSPDQAIDRIHEAGGVAVLAHPVAYMYEQNLSAETILEQIKKYGFDGIEAIYYYYYKSGGDVEVDRIEDFVNMALDNGLLVTGGSDYHGSSTDVGMHLEIGYPGKLVVPGLDILNSVKKAAKNIRER